jgi:hypothetical protein
MAGKSKAEQAAEAKQAAQEALKLVEQEARLRERMNSGYDEYIKAVKEANALQETLLTNKNIEEEVRKRIKAVEAGTLKMSEEELAAEVEKLKILEKQNKLLGKQVDLYKKAAKEANVAAMTLGKASKGLVKTLVGLPGMVERAYGKIKGLGLFELDKAMKQSALSMGVLSKESVGFRNNIKTVAKETQMIGVGIEKLSQLSSAYSENLGRNVMLSKEGLKAMGEMVAATQLGVEGTAQMAADMELQGVSAEKTGKFIEQTMNDSHKMGLNASKVLKNITGNMKMLNRYNFKDGTKGLAKMAELVTRLGVDMEFASGFADKLWDVEGAVDLSAQLQVMGGAWANMADPFHLMYMARNDMEGLTEEIGNAAAQSVKFNERTGEFDMAAKEMHKLKIIAEQTGMSYDDLVTAGKNAKKFSMIKSQIRFDVGGGEEGKALQDYLTNKALFQDGKAYIQVKGEKKLISTLTDQDKKILKAEMEEKKSMKERAEEARTFDEALTNLINQLKIYLLPLIEKLSDPKDGLIKKLDTLAADFNKPGGWGDKIEYFAGKIGEFITAVGGWIIEHPKLTAGLLLFSKAVPLISAAFKLFGGVWDTIKWFKNGVALGEGFNTVASAGGGGGDSGMDMDMDMPGGKRGHTMSSKIWKTVSKVFGGKKTMVGRAMRNMSARSMNGTTGKMISKMAPKATSWAGKAMNVAGKGLNFGGKIVSKFAKVLAPLEVLKDQFDFFSSKSMRKTGGAGWLESLGGSGMSLIDWIPGINQATEWAGLGVNNMNTDNLANARAVYRSKYPSAPTILPNKVLFKDIRKNPKDYPDDVVEDAGDVTAEDLEDGIIRPGRGRHVIKNEYGKTWITKSGDGLAVSPNISQTGGGGTMRHEFGSLNISGNITVNIPGASSLTVELTKDETFRRHITRMVQEEAVKQLNQGKPKP